MLLPLIGTLIYFLLRKPTEEEILGAQAAAAAQRGQLERPPAAARRVTPGAGCRGDFLMGRTGLEPVTSGLSSRTGAGGR